MQTAKLHASRKCNCIKIIIMKPPVDSVQFFNTAILAKYSIVSLRCCSVDFTPTLHCTQDASPCDMLHKEFHTHMDSKKLEGTLNGTVPEWNKMSHIPGRSFPRDNKMSWNDFFWNKYIDLQFYLSKIIKF